MKFSLLLVGVTREDLAHTWMKSTYQNPDWKLFLEDLSRFVTQKDSGFLNSFCYFGFLKILQK